MANSNQLTVSKLSRFQKLIIELLKWVPDNRLDYYRLSQKLAINYKGPATIKINEQDKQMLQDPKIRDSLEKIWSGPLPEANKNLNPMRVPNTPTKYIVTNQGLIPEHQKQYLSNSFKSSLSRSLKRLEKRGLIEVLFGERRDPDINKWLPTKIICLVKSSEEAPP